MDLYQVHGIPIQEAHKVQKSAWYVQIFETRYESNLVCPTNVLS